MREKLSKGKRVRNTNPIIGMLENVGGMGCGNGNVFVSLQNRFDVCLLPLCMVRWTCLDIRLKK